jgi:hypothetical protein
VLILYLGEAVNRERREAFVDFLFLFAGTIKIRIILFVPQSSSFSSFPFGGAVFEHEENKSTRWQSLLLVVLTFLSGGGFFIVRFAFFFFLLGAVGRPNSLRLTAAIFLLF